ncbi:orotidine 5'-phosphate decarboxylase [Tasmannia lanceolata]|uniref:orotidine 5'-phosphate decarboxylase n=1 Tax=Tasmannia lanceolata TaxID=3420 RepID=UPI004063FC01
MQTIHASKAIRSFHANGEANTFVQAVPCNIQHVNLLISTVAYHNSFRNICNQRLHTSPDSWKFCRRRNDHHLAKISNQGTLKGWLRRLHICASSDDEFRSSRNIAISLFRRYRNVIDRGGGDNLKEFISAGVNAYALGCTDEGLRKELMDMKDSGVEIEGMQTYGGTTSLKSKIYFEEVHECILWLSIIFITILCTPQPTVVRWSSTPPVLAETMLQWKGFCALIANAYYIRGMAWLPVKTLQLEQMAVVGNAEEPSVVASRMRLVFSTLEVVSPQWPRV